jgi:inner membrane protein
MYNLRWFCESRGGKIFFLVILVLFFLIPGGMIRSVIYERAGRAEEAEREIMKSWGGEFAIQGPVLRVPCRERLEIKTLTEKAEEKTEIRERDFFLYIVPEDLHGEIRLETQVKVRGIFSVPLFAGTARLSGSFSPARIKEELKENQRAFPEKAQLIIALANQRGIRAVQSALWNAETVRFLPGNQGFVLRSSAGGIHAAASLQMNKENTFDITLDIQGGKSLRMIPLGETSVFDLETDWASPSFQGSYLPVSRSLNEKGFRARWEVSHLSRNIPLAWTQEEQDFSLNIFGVNFFKALDHYDVNIRAVKYAIFFIVIPFLSFFLFEIFLRRNIHPVQYLLAGTGNVMFYLLLLSFSEHIPFTSAYGISALALVLMTSLYSRSLLGAWGKSWIMGAIMALLYAFLYFTLQSEDWALLMGSVGAFGVTAFVMFLTRKLDWQGGAIPAKAPPGEKAPGLDARGADKEE